MVAAAWPPHSLQRRFVAAAALVVGPAAYWIA
jgi:hypothetical protein